MYYSFNLKTFAVILYFSWYVSVTVILELDLHIRSDELSQSYIFYIVVGKEKKILKYIFLLNEFNLAN